MPEGSVMATFVIVFREMLEAGLIMGIILAVLGHLGARRYVPLVLASVALAVVASLLAGWALGLVTNTMRGDWEKIIEGLISLVACGVLTSMVFWMDRQAKRIRSELEQRMGSAVSRRQLVAMMGLPFLAVLREGAETVLFLQAVAIQSSGSVSLIGGLGGSLLATGVTVAIFVGGQRIPLRLLFRSTGALLLLMAAGLLAYGIHELQELGWIPLLTGEVWNINHLLNEQRGLGAFLKALFGYNGNPSGLEVAGYVVYLAVVSVLLRSWREPPSSAASSRLSRTPIPRAAIDTSEPSHVIR